MFNNSKIKDVNIYRTIGDENCYQLVATYNNVDELGNVDEISVKTLLNFADKPDIVLDSHNCQFNQDIERVDFGFGDVCLCYYMTENPIEITSKRILTNCKEMTIEEIQKELGYKVKIVGGKK